MTDSKNFTSEVVKTSIIEEKKDRCYKPLKFAYSFSFNQQMSDG